MKLTPLAVVGLIISLFAAGCADEGNVFSLEVGDCFGEITDTALSDVEIVDCSEPHEHEVFAVWDVVGDSLPSQSDMNLGCIGDRFEDAVGLAYEDSVILAAAITPSADGFEQGDREVICYAAEFDESNELAQVTGSVLNSNR